MYMYMYDMCEELEVLGGVQELLYMYMAYPIYM